MNSIWVRILIVAVAAVWTVGTGYAAERDIMFVDVNAAGPGDGSVADPFVTIGQALAATPSEIRIAEGTYYESITVYQDLKLRGGYMTGTWFRDPVVYPTIIVGQDESAVFGTGSLGNLEVSGLTVTGRSGVTRYGINLAGVFGSVIIEDNIIYDIHSPDGTDGVYCFFTPECEFHGTPGFTAIGIYGPDQDATISGNRIYNIHGGNGGNGNQWDYAAGHTDGGDGGAGASAFGIYSGGEISDNIIFNIQCGTGGNGGDGFDDTGYGGDGGPGGITGMAVGIFASSGNVTLFNNLIFDVVGGEGGEGGDGTWWASPADGGCGGPSYGIFLGSAGTNMVAFNTVDSLTAGSGGEGGSAFGYSGPPLNPGADGGNGGECAGIRVGSTVSTVDVNHCILTETIPGTAGSGGTGTVTGEDGAAGTAYGMSQLVVAGRTVVSSYNCLWNHPDGNYLNVTPGSTDINADPIYVMGIEGEYYLSQIAAGQGTDSPCADSGDPAEYLFDGTTRSDSVADNGIVDIGYHYLLLCRKHGDVNDSGDVTAEDAQITFAIAMGTYMPTHDEACAANCNGEGDVTAGDSQAVFFKALGMGTCVDAVI